MKIIFEENILIGEIDLLGVLTKHFAFDEHQRWTIKEEIEANYI
jgi:hypothetical protein